MLLIASAVSARFGSRHIFEDVTVRVRPGELIAVVGPSGSGKSTLLSITSGLMKPTTGSVAAIADDGSLLGTPLPYCSWVPQGSNHLGARTVLDNVIIGGLGSGRCRREAQGLAEVALLRVGLLDRVAEPSWMLSGGELQRLAIARALCLERQFLFADEPTGQLDASNTRLVFDLFRSAADSGLGVVIATHDLSIADSCNVVVEL